MLLLCQRKSDFFDDTRQLVKIALWALKHLYKRDYNYAKAGVSLGDLMPRTSAQFDMFASGQSISRTTSLMSTIDRINSKMGRESIKLPSEGFASAMEDEAGE